MSAYEIYVEYIYNIIKKDCGGLDSIYEDYIKKIVGELGFNALYANHLLESCGVINGRALYVLCDK